MEFRDYNFYDYLKDQTNELDGKSIEDVPAGLLKDLWSVWEDDYKQYCRENDLSPEDI